MSVIWLYLTSSLVGGVSAAWTLGAILLALFFLAPGWLGSTQSRSIIGIAGVVLIFGGGFYWWAFHAGENFAVSKMAAREQQTMQHVRERSKEVDKCNGGVDWDVTTGTCASQ